MTRRCTVSASAAAECDERPTRVIFAVGACAFAAYAVWGSLFPFDFHEVPWTIAAARFWGAWAIPMSQWSRSDLVSNVLLFVPIGLCATAAADRSSASGRRATSGRVVIVAAALLSAAVEFAQAFVSSRTPSIVDVAAEITGAAGGVAIWRAIGAEIDARVLAAATIIRQSPPGERVLLAYCAVFAVAWLVPADFTLRPLEIADKFAHKRLLAPFSPSPDAATTGDLAAIGAAAMPIGVTATLCGCGGAARRSAPMAMFVATTFLVGLESAQIFVFSRTTDATTLVVASATAVVAVGIAAVGSRRPIAGATSRREASSG